MRSVSTSGTHWWLTLKGREKVRAAGRRRRNGAALAASVSPVALEVVEVASKATVKTPALVHQENRDTSAAERVELFYRHMSSDRSAQVGSPLSGVRPDFQLQGVQGSIPIILKYGLLGVST